MLEEPVRVLRFLQAYGDGLAAAIPAEDFAKQPAPGMNPPAWIFGHLAFALDRHATFVGGEQHLGDWKEKFGKGSMPSADAADYPTKDELLAAWRGAIDRIIAAVESAPPEAFAVENTYVAPESLPTIGDFLTFSMTGHTSLHLGQLSAWRRAIGQPSLF